MGSLVGQVWWGGPGQKSDPAVVAYLSMPQQQRLWWGLDELARQSMKQSGRKSLYDRGGGLEEEMDENDEKQMEGVFLTFFFWRDYLPVTQVELTRCIVGRLYEFMPSFLWLQIDRGGLAAVMQLSAVVEKAFRWFTWVKVPKSFLRRSTAVFVAGWGGASLTT